MNGSHLVNVNLWQVVFLTLTATGWYTVELGYVIVIHDGGSQHCLCGKIHVSNIYPRQCLVIVSI